MLILPAYREGVARCLKCRAHWHLKRYLIIAESGSGPAVFATNGFRFSSN
jgi:hypothetical protein